MAKETIEEHLENHPNIRKRWSTKNNDHLLKLTVGSNKKSLWICQVCGDQREYSIITVVKNPDKCAVCSGQVVSDGINDLATTNPDLVIEWSTKNSFSPNECTSSSSKIAYWVCSFCGKEWSALISNRSRSKHQSGCSECNRKRKNTPYTDRTIPYGENVPEFMKNSYAEKEGTHQIGSKKKIKWVCPDNPNHYWVESPLDLSLRLSCPYCEGLHITEKGRISKRKSLSTLLPENKTLCSFIDPTRISVSSSQRVTWICDEGHIWVTPVYQRKTPNGLSECMYCADYHISSGEKELREFMESLYPGKLIFNNRKIIHPYELDIYVPEKKIAFEYNGLYWHSDKFQNKNYHHNKWESCRYNGIQLITIWEDDWRDRNDAVKSMITHKLGLSEKRVFARNTVVRECSIKESKEFLDRNHIQGYTSGSTYIGLLEEENIIAISVWRKNNKTLYLERYATSTTVVGGMGKLLKQGIQYAREHGCTEIVTFADHQVSDGGLYEKLGFRLDKELKPDYQYVVGASRIHKFNYRLKRFRNDNDLIYEEGKSESELAELNSIQRVWDCGKSRYVFDLF